MTLCNSQQLDAELKVDVTFGIKAGTRGAHKHRQHKASGPSVELLTEDYGMIDPIIRDTVDATVRHLQALVKQQAEVIEAQSEQEPFPFSAERVTYHKTAPVVQQQQEPVAYVNHNLRNSIEWEEDYAELPNVTKLYTAPLEQPDMVLVPREPTEAMLAVIRNERGAYGTGEALYADLIAAAEGKK